MANAKLVKELRDRTGAGFLDCKKALTATNEDIEKAIAWLQERGAAKAAKKAGAIAAEGVVAIASNETHTVIYEVNAQTDFVAQNKEFNDVVAVIGEALLTKDFVTAEEANKIEYKGKTITQITTDATAKIGEKILLRRAFKIKTDGVVVGGYTHTNKQVAALFVAEGSKADEAKNVAMHITAMNPEFLNEASVPADKIEKIKKESLEKLMDSPKKNVPDNIKEKILSGMLRKALSELTLVDQEFVMEKMSVAQYLKNSGLTEKLMVRYEVGEGIEKQDVDFAAEVAAQMAG